MELFKLLGTIAIDNSGANKALDDTTEKGEETHSKLSSAFGKVGSAAIQMGKVIATGVAAGSAAVVALTKQSIQSYADYEQLVGGVETLYGTEIKTIEEYAESVGKTVDEVGHQYEMMMNRQNKVMENANNAYKTAGMSVNEYMETVNGFAASLTASLGEYEWQAAGYADMIVTDMADNANKMGTSMESIQNAYSGFAKQNYTMLDNLKLGYGGTKEEMERLLRDAEKYAGYIEGSLKIESFADIADAINIVQTELGITGTTAKEAASTISGSLASMKSAWSNLIVGIADDQQDMGVLMDRFVDSASTAFSNLLPRIEKILGGIGELISRIVPIIVQELPGVVSRLLPGLISAATKLFTGVVKALPGLVKVLIEQIPSILSQIGTALVETAPILLDAVKEIIGTLTEFIATELFGIQFDSKKAFSAIGDSLKILGEKFGQLKGLFSSAYQAIKPLIETGINVMKQRFDDLMVTLETVVLPILSVLYDAFVLIGTEIFTAIQPALEKIASVWSDLTTKMSETYNAYILPVLQAFVGMIGELFAENQDKISKIGELFGAVFNFIAGIFEWFNTNIVQGIFIPAIQLIASWVYDNMENIKANFQAAFDIIGGIIDFFVALFEGDWEGMWEAVKSIQQAGREFIENTFNLLKSFLASIGSAIGSVILNVFENIRLTIVTKVQQARDVASAGFEVMKNAISDKLNQAKNVSSAAFEFIKTNISNQLNQAKNIASSAFDAIKNAISDKINSAKDTVASVIDAIRDLFNFEWSLPELKLPHIQITGEWDLAAMKFPSFDIEWYAKGGVLTEPTIFGMNGNKAMVGGEAGAEAVAPIDVLQGYVADAVASQNNGLIEVLVQILKAIYALDDGMADKLYNAMLGLRFEVNEREFARLVKAV